MSPFIALRNFSPLFYAYHSVHREPILKKFQQDDTLYSTLLFPVSRCTCFGRNPRPSSGTQFKLYSQHLGWQPVCVQPSSFWLIHDDGWTHTVCQPRCCEYSLNWAPDDGRGLRPKHVLRLTGNNKVLYKVSSRWNFLNLNFSPFHFTSLHFFFYLSYKPFTSL
jgi:hypothetical protein